MRGIFQVSSPSARMYSPAAGIPCTEEGMLLVDTFSKTTRLAFKEKDGVGPLARPHDPSKSPSGLVARSVITKWFRKASTYPMGFAKLGSFRNPLESRDV